jgi:hypothetical protein
VAFLVMNVFD